MGIERARVVEVYAAGSAGSCAGSGYQIDGRLVLTSAHVLGPSGSAEVRPAGAGTWVPATVVWRGDAAVIDVSDPSGLLAWPRPPRWGQVAGHRPVAVTGMGFPPVPGRPRWARDPEQFAGQLSADGTLQGPTLCMAGAALFAGAELVGVVAGEGRAVSVAALATDAGFAELVGTVAPVRVETPSTGFPMLR